MKPVILISVMVGLSAGVALSRPLRQIAEKQIVITATQTGIYKFPSENTTQLSTAKQGDKFVVLGRTTEGWYQIRIDEKIAYVPGSDADMVRTPAGLPKMAEQQPQVVLPKTDRLIEIKVAETQIRSYVGDKWPVLATAKAGEKFPVLSRTRSGWYQIAFHNQFGYIPVKDARLLPLAKSEKATAQQEAAAALPVSEEAPPLQTTAPPPLATEKSKFPTTWVLVGVLAVFFVVILVAKSARETHELEDRLRHK